MPIETKRGGCGWYRVGLDIVNGAIIYDGNPYRHVIASGLVRVSGSMGNQQAHGTVRLSRMWKRRGMTCPRKYRHMATAAGWPSDATEVFDEEWYRQAKTDRRIAGAFSKLAGAGRQAKGFFMRPPVE